MANGQQVEGFQYEDISDPAQVRNSDLSSPESLYLPLARVFPNVDLERVSMLDLLDYFTRELPFGSELETAARGRQVLAGQIASEVLEREALDTNVETNTHNIGLLSARIAALEQRPSGGGGTHPDTSGQVTFGLQDSEGNLIGTSGMESYQALPATVSLTFPVAMATTDRWYITVPEGVTVRHIWNTGLVRRDELGRWRFDASSRTYSWVEGITIGAEGSYDIALVASGG